MLSLAVCGSSGVHRYLLFPQPPLSGEGRHLQDFFTEKPLSIASFRRRRRKTNKTLISAKPSSAELSAAEDEWLNKLPDKKKPLYSHSLPCIEAWLKNLGFYQSHADRAVWVIERPDWHAQLSLDVTDLYVRYRPFWICITLIFVAASIWTFVTYLAHKFQKKEWGYDNNMVTWSAGLFYGYVTFVPLGLYITSSTSQHL